LRVLAAEVVSRSGDESIGEANWRFHQAIHRAAHSPRVLTQIRQAVRVVPSNFLTVFPEHEKHSLDEHEELLDAFAARDPERARAIAERHVLEAGRSLIAWLDRQSGNGQG
jgi:DNA-binding GntR family transcriptional regulator